MVSCGYAFQGSGSVLPNDIKTLAIRRSENETVYPGLSLQLTEKLVSRFSRYGVVRVVNGNQDADAELITSIKSINYRVANTTGKTDVALEYEMEMVLFAELRRRNGQVLYRNPTLRTAEMFAGGGDVVVTSSSQFQQSGITSDTLSGLSDREVLRGAGALVLDQLMDESARVLYLDAVAAEF